MPHAHVSGHRLPQEPRMPARPARPADVETYLARLPDDKRAALERLRRDVLAAAPGAEDVVAWSMPSFRLDGRLLVCYAAARNHCSLYPMSTAVMAAFAEALTRYDTSKGTIRFPSDKPLPATLVKKIVRARIAENREKGSPRRARDR
jgi:uncharacterized protein YdhG (YjbR/CyaY superfamily)